MTVAAIAIPGDSLAEIHLDIIRSVLGSDRAIAALLDISPSQVSRWRRGQVPDPDNADRLAGLSLVIEMAARWFDPAIVPDWLGGPNMHLGDRTPAYMLRRGRVADVLGALEADKAGVYG